MPERPPQEEIDRWTRWFAVEANNEAWGLVDRAARSAEEDAAMLHAAHAAAWHWARVGTEANAALADLLLGHVHAALGLGATAPVYARRALEAILAGDRADWEVAMAHAVMAHAAAAAGDTRTHADEHGRAVTTADAIADAEERAIFDTMFATIPKP